MKRQIRRRPWYEDGKLVGMMVDGQRYRFLRIGIHITAIQRRPVDAAFYAASCIDCGEDFEAVHFLTNDMFGVARKCEACRPSAA